jgi:hypothetical protein
MLSTPEEVTEGPVGSAAEQSASGQTPTPTPTPEAEPEAAPISPRARAVFVVAVVVFLVIPALVMFTLLRSGSDLSNLFNSILSDLGKQLSGIGNRI